MHNYPPSGLSFSLPPHVSVEPLSDEVLHPGGSTDDSERQLCLAAGESGLMKVWDNDADDVYNELLAP